MSRGGGEIIEVISEVLSEVIHPSLAADPIRRKEKRTLKQVFCVVSVLPKTVLQFV